MNLLKYTAIPLFILPAFALHAQESDTLKSNWLSVHGQTTVIEQYKPAFSAPYSGPNSLITDKESKTSVTATFYAGVRLWKGASVFVNPELAGGSGLSGALGIAAATNGETFRIGDPAPQIYLGRLYFTQVFALSKDSSYQEDDLNQLGGFMPNRYFSVTAGKVSISDYFDDNKYSHDPRTQFLSWGLMSNGAWDYPANTRGYTPSLVLEYVSPKDELRFGFSLVPKLANGNDMNWNLSKAGAYELEYTRRYSIHNRAGAVRILGFYNTTDMGSYKQALEQAGPAAVPDITATRAYGRSKYGFGINAEQDLTDDLGGFVKASWNDGHNETWMFTEIDHSISAGLVLTGRAWKRPGDHVGLAYVGSGLSKDHRDYLRAGGEGFILGDGYLTYGWEHLAECYYAAELIKDRIFLSGAYQLVLNPGYNKDRQGPVNVFSVRVHFRV